MKFKISLILLIIFTINLVVFSQNNEPNGIVLKVTLDDKNLPVHNLAVRSDKPNGVWFSKFPRLPEIEKKLKKSDFVRAIDFYSEIKNGIVSLDVSVLTGEKAFEDKKLVKSYSLKLNDEVIVKDLEKFGVKPVKINVIKIAPTVAFLPTIVNQAESLQVAVEPNYSTLPSFNLKIINNSGKAVKALSLHTKLGDRVLLSGKPRNLDGRDLIKNGETLEKSFENGYEKHKKLNPETSADSSEFTFNLTAVVFSDGSYEGNLSDVKTILGYYQSEQIYIRRTLPVLYEWLKETDLEKTSSALSGINTKIDISHLQNLYDKYPDLFIKGDLKTLGYIQWSTDSNKRRLIIDFNQFKRNPENSNAKIWLENTIKNLETQLKLIEFIK